MNQLELNKAVSEAYGIKPISYGLADTTSKDKFNSHIIAIPLHQDTLTLFRLCIEHAVSLDFTYTVVYVVYSSYVGSSGYYKDYPTKELATCSAMFAALAKLKGIENE